MGFSRQQHWSGLPFPSPVRESEVAQSCPTLSDLMDCSLPGSSVHGIFQARVLECGAIAFSEGFLNSSLKNTRAVQETRVRFLSREDPLEKLVYPLRYSWASLVAQLVKNPPAMLEPWV